MSGHAGAPLLAILAADDQVHLRIESVPVGATVMVGTREVGVTSLTVEVPRGQQVAVSAWSGGQRAFSWVSPDRDTTIRLRVPLPSRALRSTLGSVLTGAVDPSCQRLARAIREDGAGWEFDAEERKWTASAQGSDTTLAVSGSRAAGGSPAPTPWSSSSSPLHPEIDLPGEAHYERSCFEA